MDLQKTSSSSTDIQTELLKSVLESQRKEIFELKYQLEAKQKERYKIQRQFQESTRNMRDENEREIRRIEDKCDRERKRLQQNLEDDLKMSEKQAKKNEELLRKQMQFVNEQLKSQTKRLQEHRQTELKQLKDLNDRQIKQLQVHLAELQNKERTLLIKQKQDEIQIRELRRKVLKNNCSCCAVYILAILLILAVLGFFLFFNTSVVLQGEVNRREDALKYIQHAYKEKVKYMQDKVGMLEDKNKCSIM